MGVLALNRTHQRFRVPILPVWSVLRPPHRHPRWYVTRRLAEYQCSSFGMLVSVSPRPPVSFPYEKNRWRIVPARTPRSRPTTFARGKWMDVCTMSSVARVAQWIEHRSPKAGVARSNRVPGTIFPAWSGARDAWLCPVRRVCQKKFHILTIVVRISSFRLICPVRLQLRRKEGYPLWRK